MRRRGSQHLKISPRKLNVTVASYKRVARKKGEIKTKLKSETIDISIKLIESITNGLINNYVDTQEEWEPGEPEITVVHRWTLGSSTPAEKRRIQMLLTRV